MKRLAEKRSAVKRSAKSTDPEAGYVLLAVIFLTVILLISLAVAAPKMARSIQRDKEMETVNRGEQYKRAIKLYYQKFGRYPTTIDQLVETNQVRFLRKKYKDPLTGKADWKPVLFGQAHVRPLGFFGQPLMTVGLAGNASMYAVTASTTTDANGVPIASPDQPGASGSSNPSGFGSSPSFGSPSGIGSSPTGGSPTFGSMTTPGSAPGSPTSSPFGSSGSGTSATTFGGGGPIVGFTLPIDKPSLIEYKQQKRYNKWEFNYDPMEDQAMGITGPGGGGSPSSTNPAGSITNPMGTPPGLGTPPGGTGTPPVNSLQTPTLPPDTTPQQ
jgi:type II secretory pathway pseudopilin PulG